MNEETSKRAPRFTPEAPGSLAEAESAWLLTAKGVEVTPAQVRAVLMYHSEFQKSDVREAQRQEEQQLRAQNDVERQRKAAERVTKAKEAAQKAQERAEKALAHAEAVEAEALAKAAPEPAKRTTRRSKTTEAGAA